MKVKGEFTVKLQPLETWSAADKLGRMSIDKNFSGPLQAHSRGEMLSAMTAVEGSAGYVAIEKVEGSLEGKQGSFVLQHFATMHQGKKHLQIEVVADSATGELEGLRGSMDIEIKDGQHFYEFDFEY